MHTGFVTFLHLFKKKTPDSSIHITSDYVRKYWYYHPRFGNPADYPCWDKYTSYRIATLHPLIRDRVYKCIISHQQAGIYIRVASGFRTLAEQYKHYKNRTSNAKPGQSFHNYGLAVDLCIYSPETKTCSYNFPFTLFTCLYNFEWGGTWSKPDKPHFQKTFGYSWSQLWYKLIKKDLDDSGYVKI